MIHVLHRAGRVAALLIVAASTALMVGACGDDSGPETYTAAVRAGVMEGCVEDDSDPDLVEVCECTYDAAADEWSFTDFEQMETRLAQGDEHLPAALADIIRDCIRSISAERD